jgi:hypothetical protein
VVQVHGQQEVEEELHRHHDQDWGGGAEGAGGWRAGEAQPQAHSPAPATPPRLRC